MDIKISMKTIQINNSGGDKLEYNQGGHQQPMVLNQHENLEYTRDQLWEIKQKVREYISFKISSSELCHNREDLELTKEKEGVGNTKS